MIGDATAPVSLKTLSASCHAAPRRYQGKKVVFRPGKDVLPRRDILAARPRSKTIPTTVACSIQRDGVTKNWLCRAEHARPAFLMPKQLVRC
jgi:hypothetical protein